MPPRQLHIPPSHAFGAEVLGVLLLSTVRTDFFTATHGPGVALSSRSFISSSILPNTSQKVRNRKGLIVQVEVSAHFARVASE